MNMNTSVLDVITDPDRCEFVKKLPESLHLKCPVCFDILLPEPHLLSCCGHHLCGKCVEALGKYDPCPLCKAGHNAQFKVPDKGLAGVLNSLKIYCPNKDKSCDWIGRLGDIYHHLAVSCLYVLVSCKYKCGISVTRSDLETHESLRCPLKPDTCIFCEAFAGTYVQVLQHKRQCPKEKIDCLNQCGSRFPRENKSKHIENCPLVPVNCTFSYAGCSWVDARELHEIHLEQEWKRHISLISSYMMELVSDQDGVISALTLEVEKQGRTIQNLIDQVKSLKSITFNPSPSAADETSQVKNGTSPSAAKTKRVVPVRVAPVAPAPPTSQLSTSKNGASASIVKTKSKELPHVVSPAPVPQRSKKTFVIDRFQYRKQKSLLHYSSPFKACQITGYLVQLSFYWNGVNEGKGTHISVYINILSSCYDKWVTASDCCCVKILVRLLSQTRGVGDYEVMIPFKENPMAAVDSFMSPTGQLNGTATFIEHSKLHPYLKKDTLTFEII